MSTTTAPSASRAPATAAPIGAACPEAVMCTDAMIADAERDLKKAMRRRADGSWHQPKCREYHVNSIRYECSPSCLDAQATLAKIKAWCRQKDNARFLITLDARITRIRVAFERKRPQPEQRDLFAGVAG